MTGTGQGEKGVWLAIGVLAALLVGGVAGLLKWIMEPNVAEAALTGGGGFGAALALWIAVLTWVSPRP